MCPVAALALLCGCLDGLGAGETEAANTCDSQRRFKTFYHHLGNSYPHRWGWKISGGCHLCRKNTTSPLTVGYNCTTDLTKDEAKTRGGESVLFGRQGYHSSKVAVWLTRIHFSPYVFFKAKELSPLIGGFCHWRLYIFFGGECKKLASTTFFGGGGGRCLIFSLVIWNEIPFSDSRLFSPLMPFVLGILHLNHPDSF